MNQVIVSQPRLPYQAVDGLTEGEWKVLCEATFPNAKTAEAIVMAINYCKARKLDIFKRPVNIVPMWNSSLGKEVETVWPGINEVQVTASRTGKYAGMDEPKWGKDITMEFTGERNVKGENGKWEKVVLKESITYPEYCSITVYRMVEGQRCAFTEPVYWIEAYARQGKTDVPNAMWAKRPRGQLMKVAKAFSLRAAFPEEGEYTAEEMEGKVIEAGGVVIDHEPVTKNVTRDVYSTSRARNDKFIEIMAAIEATETHEQLKQVWKDNSTHIKAIKLTEAGEDIYDKLEQAKDIQKQVITDKQANIAAYGEGFNQVRDDPEPVALPDNQEVPKFFKRVTV